jgi:hypothetical protein
MFKTFNLSLILLIAGCGSGGDNAGPVSTANVEATFVKAYTQRSTRSGIGKRGITQDRLDVRRVTREPLGPTVFEGVPAEHYLETNTYFENGQQYFTGKRYLYLSRNPLRILGLETRGGYSVFTGFEVLPTQAKVGDGEIFARGKSWTDSTKTEEIGLPTSLRGPPIVGWRVEEGDGTFVWVCYVFAQETGRRAPSHRDCFGVNGVGSIVKYRWEIEEWDTTVYEDCADSPWPQCREEVLPE